MWTRAELKEKGRMAFKRNYWKTVLISFIMALLVGGAGGVGGGYGSRNEVRTVVDVDGSGTDVPDDVDTRLDGIEDDGFFVDGMSKGQMVLFIAVIAVIILIFVAIVLAIVIAVEALLINPIEVGMRRFFYLNLNSKAEAKEIAYAFDSNYKNIAKTMFFRDLSIVLWSLLLIIPGIVKAYEYRMVMYLLAENPDLSKDEALAISRQMMDGQKWKAFVLDLSFIGWRLLSVITLGILNIFYVSPYKNMTDAALYEALKNSRAAAYIPQEE